METRETRTTEPAAEPVAGCFELRLLGPFRCQAPDGTRVEVTSRKGRALLAMLAMASGGERTRGWLQDKLWGSRGKAQAQQSLRNEIAALRRILGPELIAAAQDQVRLALARLAVDVREALAHGIAAGDQWRLEGEFLEGLDIPGEEGFEDWLRETRQALGSRLAALPQHLAPTPPAAAPLVAPLAALSPPEPPVQQDRTLLVLPAGTLAQDDGGRDAALVRLAAGFDRELHDRLARLRWLAVVAEGKPAARVARYRLESEWSRTDQGVALDPVLVDTAGGRTIWSCRMLLGDARDHAGLAVLARDLVGAVDAQVEVAEQARVLDEPLDGLAGADLAWRARWHLARLTRGDAAIARALIDRLVAERPQAAETLIQAGFCLAWEAWVQRRTPADIRAVRALGTRATAADQFDARGHLLIGMADTWLRRPDRARHALDEAVRLNPSFAQAYMQLGSALYLAGRPAEALAPMRMALRLNPHDRMAFCVLAELGMAHLMLGDHGGAVEFADLALVRRPGYWFAHLVRVNALRLAGEHARADRARADLFASHPGFDPAATGWLPFLDPAWNERLASGLAGGDHR